MCYSAQIERDYPKYVRVLGVEGATFELLQMRGKFTRVAAEVTTSSKTKESARAKHTCVGAIFRRTCLL